MRKRFAFAGTLFLIGLGCLIIENSLYQYVDEQGYLHESLFLPIGVLTIALSTALLGLIGIIEIWRKVLSSRREHR